MTFERCYLREGFIFYLEFPNFDGFVVRTDCNRRIVDDTYTTDILFMISLEV